MLSSILNLLCAEIVVEVSPDRFVFRRENEFKSLKTKIYLSAEINAPTVLGVGEEYVPTQPSRCIKLFEENKNGSFKDLVKAECLEAFFRHAFRLITKRSAMIRPKIVFKNTLSLNNILCGYQNSILASAAVNAGARECTFV